VFELLVPFVGVGAVVGNHLALNESLTVRSYDVIEGFISVKRYVAMAKYVFKIKL